MTRRRRERGSFPAECPAFELIDPSCSDVPSGEAVVGLGPCADDDCDPYCIAAYWPFDAPDLPGHWHYSTGALRPLTPAAAEMLAIVKGRK